MMIVDVDHVSSVMQKKKKKIKTTKNMENTLCSLIHFISWNILILSVFISKSITIVTVSKQCTDFQNGQK